MHRLISHCILACVRKALSLTVVNIQVNKENTLRHPNHQEVEGMNTPSCTTYVFWHEKVVLWHFMDITTFSLRHHFVHCDLYYSNIWRRSAPCRLIESFVTWPFPQVAPNKRAIQSISPCLLRHSKLVQLSQAYCSFVSMFYIRGPRGRLAIELNMSPSWNIV